MKIVLTLIVASFFYLSNAQIGLTSYSADIPMSDSLEFKYTDIESSNFAFFYRMKISGQTIDLYSRDNIEFQGEIINTIKQYEEVKIDGEYRTQASKLFTERVKIDPVLASEVVEHIIESKQLSLPTHDSLIESWKRWFLHCGNLNFEIKENGKYYRQSYHCPYSQPDSVKYKDVILANYQLIKEKLNTDSIYNSFYKQLPKGKTYSRSGYGMTYVFTDEQEEAWNKDRPRRDYLKSIRDTVDNYLNFELKKQNIKLNKIRCYGDYQLTFKKTGKLEGIKISKYDKPELKYGLFDYIEGITEIRKCKKLIRKAFKKIDLKSFKFQHKVYRIISFDTDRQFYLRDNTIY